MSAVLMTQTAQTTTPESNSAPQGTGTMLGSAESQQTPASQQGNSAPAETNVAPTTTAQPEQKAPEVYEFKAPEGHEFDPEVLKTYTEVAKELNLPKDSAQKMLDKIAPALQQRQSQQIEAINNEWITAAKADKEFGGEKLAENLSVAKKALDTFATPEFKSFLEDSRLGNNPEVIRFMLRVGRAISEDRFVNGAAPAGKDAAPRSFNDLASALYSNQ